MPPREYWIDGIVTGPCGKFMFPSRTQAKKSLKRLTKGGATRDRGRAALLGVYRCDKCDAWHVGHGRKKGEVRS